MCGFHTTDVSVKHKIVVHVSTMINGLKKYELYLQILRENTRFMSLTVPLLSFVPL